MLQWVIALPLISLLIERLLEMFDLLVTLNLFPFWRSAPPSPPRMFLQRPSRKTWRKPAQPGSPASAADGEPARVVHAVGLDTLEFPVSSYQEAVLYYEKEKALYRNQLKHYVDKYGYFFPRQVSVTGDLWVQPPGWPLRVEMQLARRERIPDVGREAQFARLVRDMCLDGLVNERSRIQTLEKISDYCYLRNRYTYAAFSFLKRQAYLVLGIVLGIVIVEVLYQGNVLGALTRQIVLGTAGGLCGFFLPPADKLLSIPAYTDLWLFRAVIGALVGSLSQPMHGLINLCVRGPGGRDQPPETGRAQRGRASSAGER